jgi:hypothetical protein
MTKKYKYKINSKILIPYPHFDDFSDDVYADEFRIVGYGVNPNTYIIYDDRSNKKHTIYLGPKYDKWLKNRLRSVDLSILELEGSGEGMPITWYWDQDRRREKEDEDSFFTDRKKKPSKSKTRKPKKIIKKCKCK